MTDIRRCAVLALLGVTLESAPALAQRPACYSIQAGDTAASLALRIAGSADRRHGPWFQIYDPAAARFIGKSQYDHIRPGWLACISNARSGAPLASGRVVTIGNTPWVAADVGQPRGTIQPDAGWYLVVLIVTMPFAWRIAHRRRKGRQAVIEEMTRFGESFIREFERPLVQPRASAPAIRSRLRFKPRRGRLEVLLAPAAGRSYPNLSDHRKNVEYDMDRVLQELRNQPFASDSLHQQGQWVVVPFIIKARQKMEGEA